jgi:aminoglycoside phosphotransferase (APT) family kinase protein
VSRNETQADVAVRLRTVLDAPVEGLVRLSGGASRETWAFTAGERELILRRDPPGRAADFGSMELEAAAIRAAASAGLAVPEVLVIDDGEQLGSAGMVMTRVEGETVARRILRDDHFAAARNALIGQLADFMAGLHGIGVEKIPGLPEPDAFEYLGEMYGEVEDTSPTFDTAFRWLHRHRPERTGRAVVHGDLRLGNVIVAPDGLRAVIDWELVHVGDPVEDLAWTCVKAWRFGARPEAAGVGTVDELLAAYEAAGGRPVARRTFEWWLVEKTLQWGIMCMKQAAAHLTGLDRSVELAAIGRRVAEVEWDLLELLAPESASAPASTAPAPDPPGLDLYGRPTAEELLVAAQEFLLGPVTDSTDGQVRFHAKVAANVLATVTRQLQQGAAAEERTRRALETLGVKELADLSAAIRAGQFDGREPELYPFLWQTVRDRLAVANPRHLGKG